jgi:hypothetical protein
MKKTKRKTVYIFRFIIVSTVVVSWLFFGWPTWKMNFPVAEAAAIAHGSLNDATARTTTSNSYVEVSQYTVSNANFSAGDKYLIVVKTSLNNSSTSGQTAFKAMHGTTFAGASSFTDSVYIGDARRSSASYVGHGYHYFTVWTAVSNENLYFALQAVTSSTTARSQEFSVMWINLSDDVTENTDWRYATASPAGNAPTSYGSSSGASLTFNGNGDDWLILGHTHWLIDSTTADHFMQINFDSAGYSQTEYDDDNAADEDSKMGMYVANAWSGSKTVKVDYQTDTSSSDDCNYTQIFALRLEAFNDHWGGYGTSAVSISSTGSWVETYTKSDYSASQTGDAAILSFEVADVAENTKVTAHRIQVDGTTVPTSFETANDILPNDAADENGMFQPYIGSLSSGTRDIDIDCNEEVDASPAVSIDIHILVIFSMELPTPDLTWATDAADFEIWRSSNLTWDTGSLACGGALTDDNGSTINCNYLAVVPSTQYRVQMVLKNSGLGMATFDGILNYAVHMNMKGSSYWTGSNPTVGGCAFYDINGDDVGATSCTVTGYNMNSIYFWESGVGTSVKIASNGTEGFMYLVTTDSSVPASSSDSYAYGHLNDGPVNEDSSKITIFGASGSQSVDIVDASGNSVTSPSVIFLTKDFSWSTQTSTGTFGIASQKVRATNGTTDETWSVNLGASDGADALWTAGTNYYDFNDSSGGGYTDGVDDDSYGGEMTVDSSGGSVAGIPNDTSCSPSAGIDKGLSDAFDENNSIDLLQGSSGSWIPCKWDFTDVDITQKIPAAQAAGSYSITMTLTIT